jgi:hypothetical protein
VKPTPVPEPYISSVVTAEATAGPVVHDTPTPSPDKRTYRGKIDELPDVAKAVLNFTPAEAPDQVNSSSIFERVANACGLEDFVGSNDFPGTINISPPLEHGWVRVTWKPGKCSGMGIGDTYSNPTLMFEISADQDHIRDIGDINNAAYFLTH